MPDLDVSDVLTDPDFSETLTVRRLAQNVSKTGFAFVNETDFNIIAVVTIGSILAIQRAADYELGKNVITVHSQTRLLSITDTTQPDIVIWKGKNFVVKKNNNWSNYGAGFTAAECELQDTTGET